MLRGLQTHFNEQTPMPVVVLDALHEKGVELVRMDCQRLPAADITTQVTDVLLAGLIPFVVITHPEQLRALPAGVYAELRNEPDLNGPDPATYKKMLVESATMANDQGVTLCAPGVSNFHPRGFSFLQAILPLPAGVVCSIHRYPKTGATWSTPRNGYRSREDEISHLRRVIGWETRFGVSEFGYHTAPEKTGWWIFTRTRQRSDEQAAWDIQHEFEFLSSQGAEFAVLYQLNDGSTNTPIDRFGIRTAAGWKRQAEVFRR